MLNFDWLKNKKVALTGGTGFLGSYVTKALLEAGAQVSCLARPGSQKRLPQNVRPVIGDCLNAESLVALVKDQDILIHMAALLFGLDWQDYLAANVRATHNIVAACKKAAPGPARIVYVSSLAACGPCATMPGASESAQPEPVSAYGWSKYCSEALLSALGSRVVIVRPPIIYGAGDKGLLPLFKSIRQTGIGVSPGSFRKFPVSVIHARDAAAAILLAASEKAAGIYHLSDGAAIDMDVFCMAAGNALGKKNTRVLHPPLALMGLAAQASALWAKAVNAVLPGRLRPPAWNPDKFREARQSGWLADSSRIQKELGFKAAMPLAEGLRQTVEGYEAEGWL